MDLGSFVRRDISGIRKDILPLSGFGILSHALADEIAARNLTREGYFYTTDMEFLEDAEPEQQPMLPPVPRRPETIRMDMTLLFKFVQESGEKGGTLPAGTQKMLERVRTILKASPQSRAMPAPRAVQQRNIQMAQSAPWAPLDRQMSTAQLLPQNRMQNPLRDPKAPLNVEQLHTPSRAMPRASDHAMLFSDVLHRAQDSGLTFAPRQGQGGVPASAQTRTAYTTQMTRQAKAEQQAAEAQSTPVWQRMPREESSDILRQMAAPRYPEAELNFVQEDAPQEEAAMPAPTAQHASVEAIRAVQKASTEAMEQTVRSALKEAAPLMTAKAQQTAQKHAAQPMRETAMQPAQSTPTGTAAQNMQATIQPAQSAAATQTQQTSRNIPPQADRMVEKHTGQAEKTGKATEISAATAAENTGANTANSAAPEQAKENLQGQSAVFAEKASAPQNMGETLIVKPVEQSGKTVSAQAEMPAYTAKAERIPALDGDRAFAQTPEEAADILRQMAAPRYPEAELNFVQEDAPQEGAAMPTPTAQHASAEAIRAVQKASAEALTESVRSAMKEAAPLMTATAQQAGRSIPPQADRTVEKYAGQAEKTEKATEMSAATAAENVAANMASSAAPEQAKENLQGQSAVFVEKASVPQNTGETLIAKPVERSGKTVSEQAEMPAYTAKAERIPALGGDRTFAQTPEEAADILRQMAAPRYPEEELNFVQEDASQESAAMPAPTAQHTSAEAIRAVQKASAEAMAQTVRSALKEAAPLMTATAQQTAQTAESALHPTLRQQTAKAAKELVDAVESSTALSLQNSRNLPGRADAEYPGERTEERLPPLSGGQTLPGQPAGQNAGQLAAQADGMVQAVELLRQSGYGAPSLEYRMEDAVPEPPMAPQMPELSRQAGTAEKSLLWLGEKVAANAARELSRMQRTMNRQSVRSGHVNLAGQWNQTNPSGQSGGAGNTPAAMQSAGNNARSGGAFPTAGRMGSQTAHTAIWTAAKPMGIPAEAQWKPGNPAAPAQMVSPAEMPHLMYQTGQSEGTEMPFAPAGSTRPAMPRLSTSLEAQNAYPALAMEYSSPMSRMEQQLQSAVAQQMSAASRPMGMQTEAGQYMAEKAAPGGMTTLDQMSAPPVNDQIVWQNPYLRSAPADMTYRSKKKPPEQPQPAPSPQTVRVSDAEIHRMADQVFRIVKDKIRQERRKMGL